MQQCTIAMSHASEQSIAASGINKFPVSIQPVLLPNVSRLLFVDNITLKMLHAQGDAHAVVRAIEAATPILLFGSMVSDCGGVLWTWWFV